MSLLCLGKKSVFYFLGKYPNLEILKKKKKLGNLKKKKKARINEHIFKKEVMIPRWHPYLGLNVTLFLLPQRCKLPI